MHSRNDFNPLYLLANSRKFRAPKTGGTWSRTARIDHSCGEIASIAISNVESLTSRKTSQRRTLPTFERGRLARIPLSLPKRGTLEPSELIDDHPERGSKAIGKKRLGLNRCEITEEHFMIHRVEL